MTTTFSKYQRNTLVLGAMQPDTPMDLGELGLISGDWLLSFEDNSLTSLDNTTFTSRFTKVSDSKELTGDVDLL